MNTTDIRHDVTAGAHCHSSAVAWPAIIGGAFAAAAVSLALLTLGAGIGFSSISPWSHSHDSAAAFTVKTAIWFIIMQWVASGLGGYIAGRLRTKWHGLHTDEVFFRDTAHGFLTWAVATVITAAFLASAVFSTIGAGVQAASTVASGAAMGGASQAMKNSSTDSDGYFVDSLFRSDRVNTNASASDVHAETARILAKGVKDGDVSAQDKAYLSQLVAAQTGLSQADAAKRVDDTIAQINTAKEQAKEAAEKARKASAQISFFTFFSLLIGAFIACVAGALGGKRRDEY